MHPIAGTLNRKCKLWMENFHFSPSHHRFSAVIMMMMMMTIIRSEVIGSKRRRLGMEKGHRNTQMAKVGEREIH
jgi:hypothetical protein